LPQVRSALALLGGHSASGDSSRLARSWHEVTRRRVFGQRQGLRHDAESEVDRGPRLGQAGQPVSAVRQQLRQLGLVPRVVWVPTTRRPPGTVVSVQPAGYLATGSTVTVTGAYQPQPHHQDNGKGHGGD
jgi:hypothetical protein